MNFLAKTLLAATLVAGGATTAIGGEFDKAIDARKAVMTLRVWNIGILGAMAKGTREYDAAAAQAAADNLVALSNLSMSGMWPEGSDSAALTGKTRALKEIWTTYPAVVEKGQAHGAAAAKMAEVAGNGVEAVQAEIKNLGGSCGACHKQFRAEE